MVRVTFTRWKEPGVYVGFWRVTLGAFWTRAREGRFFHRCHTPHVWTWRVGRLLAVFVKV